MGLVSAHKCPQPSCAPAPCSARALQPREHKLRVSRARSQLPLASRQQILLIRRYHQFMVAHCSSSTKPPLAYVGAAARWVQEVKWRQWGRSRSRAAGWAACVLPPHLSPPAWSPSAPSLCRSIFASYLFCSTHNFFCHVSMIL